MPGRSTLPDTQNSFGPVESAGADRRVRRGAHREDGQDVDQRLDVVLGSGFAEQTLLHGEGRFRPRLSSVPLYGVEEGGLLAADVRARAAPDLDVEVVSLAEDVVAEQPARAGLPDGVLHAFQRSWVLAAQIQVALVRADRVARDRHRLHEGVRVALHDHAVLEGARLGLVGVAHEVVRPVGLRRRGLPFAAGGEGGAASPDQARVGDLADDRGGADREGLPQGRVAAVRPVVVQ